MATPASNLPPACANCGTRGNVVRDSDGTYRCSPCSYHAFAVNLARVSFHPQSLRA